MRKPFLTGLVMIAVLCVAVLQWTRGQTPDAPPPPPPPPPGNAGDNFDQLHLSADQSAKMDALQKTMHEKEDQAQQEFLDGAKGVLTADQYAELEREMRRPPKSEQTDAIDINKLPRGTVVFEGGHDTDGRDRGRPVVLIASALGVPADVFRQAFSGVTPAKAGSEPEPAQVQRNKQALLKVLSPYGITNNQLDTVSNYYRYNRSKGEMWRTNPATATATIANGVVTGITITNPGSGYTVPPTVVVAGYPDVHATVTLNFTTDFKTNGSIKTVEIAEK